ncbi:MAG: apolipoprotein N-acyltransferase, partial [Flavobacteriaceae bacterium]|nr:apolipoprotein N-acyltransferase [Flavobacteriaceae bacterium]
FVPLLLSQEIIFSSKLKRKTGLIFFSTYLTFLLWNGFTTYWLIYSTVVGGVFAIVVNALLMAFVFTLGFVVRRRTNFRVGSLFLISLWLSLEYMHLHWDFAWPWLNLGNVFSATTAWVQWYDITGTFGGSLWVWVANLLLFNLLISYLKKKSISYKKLAFAGTAMLVPILFSLVYTPKDLTTQSAEVILIQPNIDPYSEKYHTDNLDIVRLIDSLSAPHLTENTRFIIAPETTLAEDENIDRLATSDSYRNLRKLTQQHKNLHILTGISLHKVFKDSSLINIHSNYYPSGDFWYNTYNSALFVGQEKQPHIYHKSKLVVGVETFPYKSILEPIVGRYMIDLGGTVALRTTQADRSTFITRTDSIGVAPIICYESVFGEFVTKYIAHKADFLAIITNDAWWDNTEGHRQHLALARLRAIETRRWIARSANTGISAIIDHKGNVVQSLGYDQLGTVVGDVRLNNQETFYVKHGDYIARVAVFMAGFTFLFSFWKPVRKRK